MAHGRTDSCVNRATGSFPVSGRDCAWLGSPERTPPVSYSTSGALWGSSLFLRVRVVVGVLNV